MAKRKKTKTKAKTRTKTKAKTKGSVIEMQEFMSRRVLGEIERLKEGLTEQADDLLPVAEAVRKSYLEHGGRRSDRVVRSLDRVAAKLERQQRDGVMLDVGDLDELRDLLREIEDPPRGGKPRTASHDLLQTGFPDVYIHDTDVRISVDIINALYDGDREGLVVELLRQMCHNPYGCGIPPDYWSEAPFAIADELATRYDALGYEVRSKGDGAELLVVDEAGTEHYFRVENAHTLEPDALQRIDAEHPAGWFLAVPSRGATVPDLPNLTHLLLWMSWPYVTDEGELDIRIEFGDLPAL